MNIVIGESSLIQTASGKVTGEIFIESNGKYFPERGWSDFPVIITSWWINNFLDGVENKKTELEFYFMDGPFVILGNLRESGKYEISMIRQKGSNEIILKDCVSPKEIKDILMKACRKIFSEAEKGNIAVEKTENLRKLFSKLKEM